MPRMRRVSLPGSTTFITSATPLVPEGTWLVAALRRAHAELGVHYFIHENLQKHSGGQAAASIHPISGTVFQMAQKDAM